MINTNQKPAYIITGPTSGIGYATALELAKYGAVILVGRNVDKLKSLQEIIQKNGQQALSIVCDIADLKSVKLAAQQIVDLQLPVKGLLNNAGIMPSKPTKSAQGWDITFATNYLGAFAFTNALTPHLAPAANVVFIASAIEDPERKPVKALGMKGGRFISIEASARGEWQPGGSKMPGIDAYATSKQCVLAATMALARENKALHFNAIEPGITRGTNLGGENTNPVLRFIFGYLFAILPPFSHYASTSEKSARVISHILTDNAGKTGVYYDEKGQPMRGSEQVSNPDFQDKVLEETCAFLAKAGI